MDAPRLHEVKLGYTVVSHISLSPVLHEPTNSIFIYPTLRSAKAAIKGNRMLTTEEVNVFLGALMLMVGARLTMTRRAFNTLSKEATPFLAALGIQMTWPVCEARLITFDCQTNDRDSLAKALAPLMAKLNAAQQSQLRNN